MASGNITLSIVPVFSGIGWRDLLFARPVLEVQVVLILLHAILWYVVISWLLPPHILSLIDRLKSKTCYLETQRYALRKLLATREDEEDPLPGFLTYFHGVIVQHFAGALLCLPSLLGCASAPVASALACHGALIEVGWEIQDSLMRIKEMTWDGEAGRRRNPTKLVVPMFMHHVLAQILVVPMNLYYHDCKLYHEAIFVLQGIAVFSYACQHFGYTCDINVAKELRQLRVATTASLVAITWSRGIHSTYLWYALLTLIYSEGRHALFWVAVFPVICMSLFNAIMVMDCCQKFSKIVLKVPVKDPPTTTATMTTTNAVLLGHPSTQEAIAHEKKVA